VAEQGRLHWPEYLIEAWALGTFMISAGVFTVLVEHPDFGVPAVIESAVLRRALVGIAMGATAVALIYSPWGRRSGAHMNPAVTLTFWWLGKVRGSDALAYVAAQFAGGSLGVLAVFAALGERFAAPPVSFVATLPARGTAVAFALEALISCGLMLTVLSLSSSRRLAPYTGLAAGVLVAAYIAFEAPYSGMSMNPARSFASAVPAGMFADLWIYFLAPPLGMALAAALHGAIAARGSAGGACAKLMHCAEARCIHCGYAPAGAVRVMSPI
jgi:aquaporin Z